MQDEKNYHAWAHRQAVVKVCAAACVRVCGVGQGVGVSWRVLLRCTVCWEWGARKTRETV